MNSAQQQEIFVPDGTSEAEALERTTSMIVGAHQDDLEIMAYSPIADSFNHPNRWVCGVVVTNGSGSPRSGPYAHCTDDEMQLIRYQEQKRAATLGQYGSLILLKHPSSKVKNKDGRMVIEQLKSFLQRTQPEKIYTHNLADKHPTHVAVALRLIAAIREIRDQLSGNLEVYGCEVWRGLDWMSDSDKVTMNTDQHPSLATALLEVFDSQIAGGKHYDLATIGRRRANATYYISHAVDMVEGLGYAMDLTKLVNIPGLNPADYVADFIEKFHRDVVESINSLMV